jgi:hypothetical protein
LERITSRHDRLYVIFWGDDQRDPEHIIERWLEEKAYKAAEEWYGDVRFVVYAVPGEAAQSMENPVQRIFGDRITLQGYTLETEQLAAGDILQLTLFWETAESLDTRYKIFLHLLDQNGRMVAQRDSEPGGGLEPTTTWEVGQSVIDNHGLLLPDELQPGEYTLIMGLYEISDPGARLSLDNGGENQDNLTLGSITVE